MFFSPLLALKDYKYRLTRDFCNAGRANSGEITGIRMKVSFLVYCIYFALRTSLLDSSLG